jgi:hypothetical protein
MNTSELELLDNWNERELTEFVAAFVRRERRLPGYDDLMNRHASEVARL